MLVLTVEGQLLATTGIEGSLPGAGNPLSQFPGSSQAVPFVPIQFVCPHTPPRSKAKNAKYILNFKKFFLFIPIVYRYNRIFSLVV
jgi:hypothetical protein